MSNWERKHKELHGTLVRRSNIALMATVAMAAVLVFGVVKMHEREEQKLIEKEYKQLQEMRKQYYKRQR